MQQEEEAMIGFRKVRPQQAADLMGVSLRTVYSRRDKYAWRAEQELDGTAWIWMPESLIKEEQPEEANGSAKPSDHDRDGFMQVLDGLREVYEKQIDSLHDQLLKVGGVVKALQEENMKLLVENARLHAAGQKVQEMERIIQAQQEAINQAKAANEALSNERVTITHQLQKYRNNKDKPVWWPWGR